MPRRLPGNGASGAVGRERHDVADIRRASRQHQHAGRIPARRPRRAAGRARAPPAAARRCPVRAVRARRARAVRPRSGRAARRHRASSSKPLASSTPSQIELEAQRDARILRVEAGERRLAGRVAVHEAHGPSRPSCGPTRDAHQQVEQLVALAACATAPASMPCARAQRRSSAVRSAASGSQPRARARRPAR